MHAGQRPWAALALLAIAAPVLIAFNQPPSATFYNQAAALLGWGALLLVLALALPRERIAPQPGLAALLAALALLALAAAASPFFSGQPLSLARSAIALLLAAAFTAWVGAAVHSAGLQRPAFAALALGLLVAGLASAAIGVVQVFAPPLADGGWIAVPTTPGRAVGNLRQPNHLASLLLWAIIAATWLADAGLLRRRLAVGSTVLLVFGVVLSASRTGLVGALLLALWAIADRRLALASRRLLLSTPLLYALLWGAMAIWARESAHPFVGETRFSGGDLSSSRFAIWRDTIDLIRTVPWTGVGFGEFNFAWSLTPFPHRPTAFFDHTHNLPLQLAVELGLPLAALVLALLVFALAVAGLRAWREPRAPGDAPPARAAFVLVLMIGVHSLLEYPLWYAYFLLPCALAFGLMLGNPTAPAAARRPARGAVLSAAALALMFGAVAALADYRSVVTIFIVPQQPLPLAVRIAHGQSSWFFSHHADYAAATTAPHPSDEIEAFAGATHYLLDTRLMVAWARALHELGDDARALHLADRLREFRNPESDDLLGACDAAPAGSATALAFPCASAPRALDWRDFR